MPRGGAQENTTDWEVLHYVSVNGLLLRCHWLLRVWSPLRRQQQGETESTGRVYGRLSRHLHDCEPSYLVRCVCISFYHICHCV